jgi:hypothetical protein
MSHTGRRGELPNLRPRRQERVFEVNGGWYVSTREGIYVGPYPTKTAVSDAAEELVELLDGIDDASVAEAFIREFARRTVGVKWWVQASNRRGSRKRDARPKPGA